MTGVSACQLRLAVGRVAENRVHAGAEIAQAAGAGAELIVIPSSSRTATSSKTHLRPRAARLFVTWVSEWPSHARRETPVVATWPGSPTPPRTATTPATHRTSSSSPRR
jgi:predicted amidohydrolase